MMSRSWGNHHNRMNFLDLSGNIGKKLKSTTLDSIDVLMDLAELADFIVVPKLGSEI